ncbi:MAG: M16 family metallopeptidase [Pyrinomonadaceae bacterium]
MNNKTTLLLATFVLLINSVLVFGQTPSQTPPPPGAPPTLSIPNVEQTVLENGLTIAVIRRPELPLVTASLMIRTGAKDESPRNAGLASFTSDLLTKGTTDRTASQVAEFTDFLGASLNSYSEWDRSGVTLTVVQDKIGRGLSIMSESVLSPAFRQSELNLLKKQTLDGFDVSLKEPGSLLRYATDIYTFGRHPEGGSPESIKAMTRNKIAAFYNEHYRPERAYLVFTGDITKEQAFALGKLFFGSWKSGTDVTKAKSELKLDDVATKMQGTDSVTELFVVDLPKSGQAAVGFSKMIRDGRTNCTPSCATSDDYYTASVLNSVLGGGYSSRLNQEIRLKRGLSYGAGSGFDWEPNDVMFTATAQTKNESADQVAELMKIEIERLITQDIGNDELVPRKAVLSGSYGRSLQSNSGLASQVNSLLFYKLNSAELNSYINKVNSVSASQIRNFAGNLTRGNIIVVGDASVFLEGLKKRFPGKKITVVSAAKLNLNQTGLK